MVLVIQGRQDVRNDLLWTAPKCPRQKLESLVEWQKLRERNEALDCRVYARAAAWILGADRWSEKQWDELARQVTAPDPEADTGTVKTARQSRPANLRRSVRSNYMT
jgi:phage terminase large subunit GpA-like protein